MWKDDQPLDPEWRTSKHARQLRPQAIANRENVALDLGSRIADVGRVRCPGPAKPGPAPAPVWLAHNPPGHRFGFDQEDAARANHQVIDVTGAARQFEPVDQDVCLGEFACQYLADVTLPG